MLLMTAIMHCLRELLLFKCIIVKELKETWRLPRGAEWPGCSRRDPRAKVATATLMLLMLPPRSRCRMAAAEVAPIFTTLGKAMTRKTLDVQLEALLPRTMMRC